MPIVEATPVSNAQQGIGRRLNARVLDRLDGDLAQTANHNRSHVFSSQLDGLVPQKPVRVTARDDRQVQPFLTTAGLVAVIDSIVAGAFVGLLVGLLVSLVALAVGTAVLAFLIFVVAHQRYQAAQWAVLDQTITPLFPSPTMNAPTP